MPNLTPVSSFDAVPELETTTLALGGPGGPMNLPLQALLNRTQWLHDNAAAGSSSPYALAAGTSNAITAAYTPTVTATADGLKLRFAAATANTGAATFAPDALTAAPILGQAGLALQGGEIAANGEVEVTWSSALSSWVMTACTGGAAQVADATASHHAASKSQLDVVSGVADSAQATADAAAPSADLASTTTGKGASLIGYLTGTVKSFLDSLSAAGGSAGAALIGFLQAGTHAVARTMQDRGRDVFNVKDVGAKCDGTTDDTTAFQNALSDLSALGGGTLTLPAGRIKLGAITLPSNVSIRGAGKYSTWIVPAGAQTCFTLAGGGSQVQQTYSDFGIDCGSTASVNGFKFTNCLNVGLYRIAFKGCVSNFEIDQGYYYDIDGCDSIGTAALKAGSCKIWSSDDTKYVFQVGLRRYTINNIGNGVQGPVVYVRRGVAVQLHQVNCNDANTGGAQNFLVIENDCQGCKVMQCGVGASTNAILVQTGTGVSVAPSFIDIISFDSDQAQTTAITVFSGMHVRVSGGNMTSSGVATSSTAIFAGSAVVSAHFENITIRGYNGATGAAFALSGSSNVTVQKCNIDTCHTGFIISGSPANLRVFDNVLTSVTAAISGSIAGSGNYFARNLGLNPQNVTTPTLPASGSFITNTTGVRCTVYVSGGTISVVYINGGSGGISASSLCYDLEPGETTAVSYTGTPTWIWHGH